MPVIKQLLMVEIPIKLANNQNEYIILYNHSSFLPSEQLAR